jgi:hypothetical protein
MQRNIRVFGAGLIVLTSLAISNPVEARGRHVIDVRLEDRCDPATFNVPFPDGLGEGACTPVEERGGTLTLQEVFAQLNPVDFGPDKWRFSRTDFSIERGDIIRVTNTGGEAHSFTEVTEFGGGCVPEINEPLGLTTVTANCPADFATVQVPGARMDVTPKAGSRVHKFMCIIHPWMRATVKEER